MPSRLIDGPSIGFQHLVTVTNTDSAVRRMLLAALLSHTPSAPSQLAQSLAVDAYRGAADDETAPYASSTDSPQADLQAAMEVSA